MKKVFLLIAVAVCYIQSLLAQDYCLWFDGTDDYVECGNTGQTIKTICFWVNPADNTNRDIISLDGGTYSIVLDASGNISATGFSVPVIRVNGVTATAVSQNTWSHVVVTTSTGISVSDLEIGRNSNYFFGRLDELRLWTTERTVSEIRAYLYKTLSGSETGLAVYYKMSDGTGINLEDNSSGSVTGTLSGGMGTDSWYTSDYNSGSRNSLLFDGSGDYVYTSLKINESSSSTGVTYQAWVYPLETTSGRHQVISPDNGGFDWSLLRDGGMWWVFNGAGAYNTGFTVDVGVWQQLTVVFNPSTSNVKAYKNGVSVTIANLSYDSYDNTLCVGYNPGYGEYLYGRIDEVRVWNRPLNEDEIIDNMCRTLTGNESGLQLYLKFDQENAADQTTVYDQTSNGYNGSIYGINTSTNWVSSNAFTTWTGPFGSEWSDANNWSAGSVPASSNFISIQDYSDYTNGNSPVLSAVTTLQNLYILSGAEMDVSSGLTLSSKAYIYGNLNINPAGYVTVSGTLKANSGSSVTVESTSQSAGGTGSLIVTGTYTGNLTCKHYVSPDKWHYVSSPVNGQALDISWMIANNVNNSEGNYSFYRWDEDQYYWINYGSTGSPEAFTDTQFSQGKGYILSTSSATSLIFSGTVPVADVSCAVTYTTGFGEGFNMVGNPFPSAIGVTSAAGSTLKFLSDNTSLLDDNYEALYIWDEQAGYSGGRNDYKVISNAGISGYTSISQDYINPGQAFFVKVTGNGTIRFDADSRYHTSVEHFKSKEVWPGLELIIEGNELLNSTVVAFHEGMTVGLDPSYDVGKMAGNSNVSLYSRLVNDNGKKFAVQALPEINQQEFTIPIGIDLEGSGVFKFSATLNDLDEYEIVLNDQLNNQFIDLKETSYLTEINGDEPNRFRLLLKQSTGIAQPDESDFQVVMANNRIHIENQTMQNADLAIFSVTGQLLEQFSLKGNVLEEFECKIPAGMYLVKVSSGNQVRTFKKIVR